MNIQPFLSTFPFLSFLLVIFCMCLLNYIILAATQMKWACNFLFHHSLFNPGYEIVPENGEQISTISNECMLIRSEGAVECGVCLCQIEEGEEIGKLRCDHLFHRVCLDRWLGNRHATCPLCRDCLAPRRMVGELGEEVIVLGFCDIDSSNRTRWWLR
ncbi:hypothetical protein L1049_006166 [Liquidambar formosana]|uniref:RING-type domain-containing protein n=1 Tax=Liquidambar formosana TaxID=63359 RepID=A0AAP0RF20_LIQFO